MAPFTTGSCKPLPKPLTKTVLRTKKITSFKTNFKTVTSTTFIPNGRSHRVLLRDPGEAVAAMLEEPPDVDEEVALQSTRQPESDGTSDTHGEHFLYPRGLCPICPLGVAPAVPPSWLQVQKGRSCCKRRKTVFKTRIVKTTTLRAIKVVTRTAWRTATGAPPV